MRRSEANGGDENEEYAIQGSAQGSTGSPGRGSHYLVQGARELPGKIHGWRPVGQVPSREDLEKISRGIVFRYVGGPREAALPIHAADS